MLDVKTKTLISEEEIKKRVTYCGERLKEKYEGKPLLFVGLLKGSFIFLADLARATQIQCEITFIKTKSYRSGKERSELTVNFDEDIDFSKFNVVIVEDIVDTGHTLKEVTKLISKKNPISLYVIALIDKPSGREVEYSPDECLFEVGNEFIVGYGLDMDGYWRNLPYIAAVI
jgi:hypoxanthine phosphoribosyltransferase